jgi:hypothetical protein
MLIYQRVTIETVALTMNLVMELFMGLLTL